MKDSAGVASGGTGTAAANTFGLRSCSVGTRSITACANSITSAGISTSAPTTRVRSQPYPPGAGIPGHHRARWIDRLPFWVSVPEELGAEAHAGADVAEDVKSPPARAR